MRHPEPTQLHHLSDRVAGLAEDAIICNAQALELGQAPPVGLWMVERELWRWAQALRRRADQAATSARPQPARLTAMVLLVEVDDQDLDPELLANAILHGLRDHGTIVLADTTPAGRAARRAAWRLRHVAAYPNLPTALATLNGRNSGGTS